MPPKKRSKASQSVKGKKRAVLGDTVVTKVWKQAKRHKKIAPASRFMELPGELRNTIYGFCQTAESLRYNPRGTRSFYSLAQVSRQVRREYLPLYASRIRHRILLSDIYSYVHTFGRVAPLMAGEIVIELSDPLGHLHFNQDPIPVNFAPLIRLSKAHPGLHVVPRYNEDRTDGYMSDEYRMNMEDWLDFCIPTRTPRPATSNQIRWAAFFDKAVVAMYVSPKLEPRKVWPPSRMKLNVRIVVKPLYVEWWMGFEQSELRELRSYSADENLVFWEKKTGHFELNCLSGLTVCGPK